ncbi:charged multivesicular body protein 4b-like [Archocentrus centrarchus]|uniref:charged multivesicular body protein 4b-like n=1 Tax=Archocentrus centrarchus TaxID=63155 RepID=UPI0011EA1B2F|nr:charged multivesicular body protein 4b-like [Archocentrus centrarchus]
MRRKDRDPESSSPKAVAVFWQSSSLTATFLSVFSSWDKVEKELQQEMEKLPAREELLEKKREFLNKKIDQLELFAKKNSTKSRRVALQALRRKKQCEKHIKYIDCAVKAMRSIHEHIEIINKVTDLLKDITEEQDVTGDKLDSVYTPVGFDGEFDEDELLAELEKLERNLDENLFEADGSEDGVLCPKVLTSAPPSHPGFCREIINKVNDLMKDIMEEQDVTEDMQDSIYTAVSFEVEFNEDELLAELDKLEKNLDESLFEVDGAEDGGLCPTVSKTASPSHPANVDEDNIEDDLEYLRRWANAAS